MSAGEKIDIGNGERVRITQSAGDLIAGINRGGDLSRISACLGADRGVHTGSNSETVGRQNSSFGTEG